MTQVNPQLAATLVPVASLTLHPNNVRRHDERSIKAVADSLALYGQQKPIVVARR